MERKRHLGSRTQPQRAAPMQAIAATASSARSDPEAGSPEGTLGALGQPCNCSVGALVWARLGSARRWPAVVVTEFPFVARDQLHLAACGSAGWLSTESPRR
ncbi:uncharacterized protein LOC144115762 [Amblyomma americanum]